MNLIANLRGIARRPLWLLWGYLLLVAAAELATSVVQPQLGVALHALLLVVLLIHAAVDQPSPASKLALALTVAPLIRLLSLALPLTRFPQAAWYPIVAIPLLAATAIIIRMLGVPRQALGLRRGVPWHQLMLAGGGLGLGLIEHAILRPAPLVATYTWSALLPPLLSLIIFTGFTEELIFRGLLQSVALPVLGRWALVYVSLLFGVLHIGYLSVADVVFVSVTGLAFAHIVRKGGSILGVTLAHGVTNVTLFMIMPYLAAHPAGSAAALAPWVFWGGTAVAIVAVDLVMLRATVTASMQPAGAAPSGGLRDLRRSSGLTYVDLAQRTGLPVRRLAEIEHGLRLPQPDDLQRIELALAPSLGAV